MLHLRLLLRRALGDQLVVDLHQQPGTQALPLQPVMHTHHRQLHDIGGAALHRHIQRHPLAEFPQVEIAALQLRQGAAAVHHGLYVAVLLRLRHYVGHILPQGTVRLEIAVHVRLGLRHGDADVLGQRKGGDAVHNAEIHRLGPAAQLRRHILLWHVEDLGGGGGVEVRTGQE